MGVPATTPRPRTHGLCSTDRITGSPFATETVYIWGVQGGEFISESPRKSWVSYQSTHALFVCPEKSMERHERYTVRNESESDARRASTEHTRSAYARHDDDTMLLRYAVQDIKAWLASQNSTLSRSPAKKFTLHLFGCDARVDVARVCDELRVPRIKSFLEPAKGVELVPFIGGPPLAVLDLTQDQEPHVIALLLDRLVAVNADASRSCCLVIINSHLVQGVLKQWSEACKALPEALCTIRAYTPDMDVVLREVQHLRWYPLAFAMGEVRMKNAKVAGILHAYRLNAKDWYARGYWADAYLDWSVTKLHTEASAARGGVVDAKQFNLRVQNMYTADHTFVMTRFLLEPMDKEDTVAKQMCDAANAGALERYVFQYPHTVRGLTNRNVRFSVTMSANRVFYTSERVVVHVKMRRRREYFPASRQQASTVDEGCGTPMPVDADDTSSAASVDDS